MLDADDLAALQPFATVRSFAKGTILITEGDDTTSFYAIEDGEVEVYRADDGGREITLNILGPGEFFGELVIVTDGARSASVRATAATRCMVVSKRDFERSLASRPQMMLKVTRHLGYRVRDLTEQVSDLALVAVYGRLVRVLNKLATHIDGQAVIERRMTHEALARQIGSCREMVTRLLGDLEAGGYLRKEGRGWVMPKPPPKHW